MALSTKTTVQHRGRTVIPPTVTLAVWRLRKTWGMLLITGMGMVAAVMLVCSVPLYSEVSMSAGLRGVLNASPENADIIVRSGSQRLSLSVTNDITRHLDRDFQKQLGPYLGHRQFSIVTPTFKVLASKPGSTSLSPTPHQMTLTGTSMEQAASHVTLIQGRLPRSMSDVVELAITAQTADYLHANSLPSTVGAVLPIEIQFFDANQSTSTARTLMLHIVGIFKLDQENDPFWHGDTFDSTPVSDFVTFYRGLVSSETIVSAIERISPPLNEQHFYTLSSGALLLWYYRLDTSRLDIGHLDNIVNGVQEIQIAAANSVYLEQFPYVGQSQTYLPSDILSQYRDRISIAQLSVLSFLCLMLGLVLFFVSMMADVLIDRQADGIAILRSRGASRRQIFGSLLTQSIGLGLIALVAGPLLAVFLVRFIARRMLSPADQSALNLIAGNPVQVALGVGGFALLAVVVAIAAMALAITRASQLDALAIRREAARSTRQPLWLRLDLDIVALIIMLLSYGFSVYMTSSGSIDTHLSLVLLSPLILLSSVFLLLACMLFFLRLFPRLLQLGTWLATRGRSASSTLALAQMARSPLQSIRMTLLLALTTAFTIFSLIFTASQAQRVLDVANYQSGADFSGSVPATVYTLSRLSEVTNTYRHIPGVISATLGYATFVAVGDRVHSFYEELRAVDSDTFAQTVIWSEQDSDQSLTSLMSKLSTQRDAAISRKVVPAIVDAATWKLLHLAPGANFAVNPFPDDPTAKLMNFIAMTEVQHIPTTGNAEKAIGGILVDYRTYATVYGKITGSSDFLAPLNTVWLRTHDDAEALASVRKALSTGDLRLDPVIDRRAIIATLYHEPLYLDLIGVLAIGATTALLLALVGNLIASWFSAHSRLGNFAVLRALGATPRQVASTLIWEQGIIYGTSIVLGIVFGAILSALIVPVLVFTSVTPNGASSNIFGGAFYTIQTTPPIRLIMPPSLGIALGALVLICVIALGMMVRVVSRPSISQTLRLNED